MPEYEVCIVHRPSGWQASSPDDTPRQLSDPVERLGRFDSVLSAVQRATEYNQHPDRKSDQRWAVVVDPAGSSRRWDHGRVCTPLKYRIASVWWPTGWEPSGPMDVPNCVLHAQSDPHDEPCSYDRALTLVRALNQQCIDQASPFWYVVVADEAEPLSRTITFDSSGVETTVEVKRFHVVRSDPDGRGRCTECPARQFDCAKQQWCSFPNETASAVTPEGS